MPALIPVILPLITAGVGAASVGESIYGLTQGGGGGSTAKTAPTTPTGPSVAQIVSATQPGVLGAFGAAPGISPELALQMGATEAGTTGLPNSAAALQQILQQILGKGGGGAVPSSGGGATPSSTPGFSPSGLPVNLSALAATPGVSDFLAEISGSLAQ